MSIRLHVRAPLHAGAVLPAEPGQAHYLGRVMRRAVGDAIVLFNGADGEWQGRIGVLYKDRAEFVAETLLRPQQAEPDLWLIFAPLKRDATDLVVQKATELGVSVLQPVITERGVAGRISADRLHSIAIEAAEQSERLSVPTINPPRTLPALLADWPADRVLAVALERAEAGPITEPAGALLIGPEGGFSPAERARLQSHAAIRTVSLGPLILRAETAAIAGMALLRAHLR